MKTPFAHYTKPLRVMVEIRTASQEAWDKPINMYGLNWYDGVARSQVNARIEQAMRQGNSITIKPLSK